MKCWNEKGGQGQKFGRPINFRSPCRLAQKMSRRGLAKVISSLPRVPIHARSLALSFVFSSLVRPVGKVAVPFQEDWSVPVRALACRLCDQMARHLRVPLPPLSASDMMPLPSATTSASVTVLPIVAQPVVSMGL